MRLVGVYNRLQRASDLCDYAGLKDVTSPLTQKDADLAIREGKQTATGDSFLLAIFSTIVSD
jgi:hypothetical protein